MKNWILDRAAWIDQNVPGTQCLSGIEEHKPQFSFTMRAYPNPAIGAFNLEIQNDKADKLYLEIFTGTGQRVYSRDIGRDPLYNERIPLSPGAYMIRVTGNSGVDVTKVVVQ